MRSQNMMADPIQSCMSYLKAISDCAYIDKNKAIVDWMYYQSPQSDAVSDCISEYAGREFIFEEDFLATLYYKLGWQNHIVMQVISKTVNILIENRLILRSGINYILSKLGHSLISSQSDINLYVTSLEYKAKLAKQNIVKIFDQNNIGTGFFIEKDTIITCKHVIEGLVGEIAIGDDALEYTILSKIYSDHRDADIIALKVSPDNPHFIPYAISYDCGELKRVMTMGFPRVPLTSKPFLIFNAGEISSNVDNYLNGVNAVVLSFIVRPGNSGGPVFDEFGRVVSVISDNIFSEEDGVDIIHKLGYSSSVPIRYIMEKLI